MLRFGMDYKSVTLIISKNDGKKVKMVNFSA